VAEKNHLTGFRSEERGTSPLVEMLKTALPQCRCRVPGSIKCRLHVQRPLVKSENTLRHVHTVNRKREIDPWHVQRPNMKTQQGPLHVQRPNCKRENGRLHVQRPNMKTQHGPLHVQRPNWKRESGTWHVQRQLEIMPTSMMWSQKPLENIPISMLQVQGHALQRQSNSVLLQIQLRPLLVGMWQVQPTLMRR